MSSKQPAFHLRDIPPDARIGVIAARWNENIVDELMDGCLRRLGQLEISGTQVEIHRVPGAFEIPVAARLLARTGRFDAIVCLGCVIRGETPHFDYIASAVAHGIMEAAAETGVPMTFGVLTTDTPAQAAARSGPGPDNKGREAAAAAIEMAALYKSMSS